MTNKQSALEKQFAHAARMVKAAIEVYPILADSSDAMFQLAVAVIREELDYKRQQRYEREGDDVGSEINPLGVRFPMITTAVVDEIVKRAKVDSE